MEPTITLRLLHGPSRGAIARHATTALAVRAGLPPLAADRAGGAVAAAVTATDAAEVTLTGSLDHAAAEVTLTARGAWSEQADALANLDATVITDDRVSFRFARTPLRGAGWRRPPATAASAGGRRPLALRDVLALGELLDDAGAERRQIVGLAAGDEAAVDDDFLVHPVGAGVAHVGVQARPR